MLGTKKGKMGKGETKREEGNPHTHVAHPLHVEKPAVVCVSAKKIRGAEEFEKAIESEHKHTLTHSHAHTHTLSLSPTYKHTHTHSRAHFVV